MYSQRYFEPETPKGRVNRRRKSRESTISADEDDEAAKRGQPTSSMRSQAETELYDSQASQAATEMLRRHPGQSMEVNSSAGSREESPVRAEVVKPRSKLPEVSRRSEKRKLGAGGDAGSPSKRTRVADERRVGLGIQFSR